MKFYTLRIREEDETMSLGYLPKSRMSDERTNPAADNNPRVVISDGGESLSFGSITSEGQRWGTAKGLNTLRQRNQSDRKRNHS